jgi:tRNA pseudouridine13 synthase
VPEPAALAAALDPPRAFGAALGRAMIRAEPDDFIVDEELGFEPEGAGPHVLLHVRKRSTNTAWVARQLARAAGCREQDVGYAGLKDRHAIATQWFSVPVGRLGEGEWLAFAGDDFQVLDARAHRRKLPRGALAGNRFRIRLRSLEAARHELVKRLELVRAHGVPNYFGPQRFGTGAANLDRIARTQTLRRAERGLVLSAARSLIFNAVLGARVVDGTWSQVEAGDLAILDGRGSTFPVDVVDASLRERTAHLEVHPTGPMWGVLEPASGGRVHALEIAQAERFAAARALCCDAGLQHERRSLRLAVHDLAYDLDGDSVLSFRLTRGTYATSVLRELLDCTDARSGGHDDA